MQGMELRVRGSGGEYRGKFSYVVIWSYIEGYRDRLWQARICRGQYSTSIHIHHPILSPYSLIQSWLFNSTPLSCTHTGSSPSEPRHLQLNP